MVPSPQEREADLVQTFVDLADTLVEGYDSAAALHRLAECCVRLLGVSAAGLMLADQHGDLKVVAASDERSQSLELFELQHSQGPCPDCFRTGQPVSVADVAVARQRWPAFVPRALQHGFASVHALPLRLRQETIGALNMFGTKTDHLSEADLRVAQALADTATIGILSKRAIRHRDVLTEQLQAALDNRVTIEQAKGMLAQAGDLEMGQAFEALRRYGRAHSTRLSEIARHLAAGTLDPAQVLTYRQHH